MDLHHLQVMNCQIQSSAGFARTSWKEHMSLLQPAQKGSRSMAIPMNLVKLRSMAQGMELAHPLLELYVLRDYDSNHKMR